MTIGKTIALTRWTFVGEIMSLLFNVLSSLFIAFLPRSKRLLISWLQSPSAVILEPKKIKSVTVCFHCFLIYLPWGDGTFTNIHIFECTSAQSGMGFPGSLNVKESIRNMETWVQSLGWEDALEEGMATHSSILAWRTPSVGHDWVTRHSTALHSRVECPSLEFLGYPPATFFIDLAVFSGSFAGAPSKLSLHLFPYSTY